MPGRKSLNKHSRTRHSISLNTGIPPNGVCPTHAVGEGIECCFHRRQDQSEQCQSVFPSRPFNFLLGFGAGVGHRLVPPQQRYPEKQTGDTGKVNTQLGKHTGTNAHVRLLYDSTSATCTLSRVSASYADRGTHIRLSH